MRLGLKIISPQEHATELILLGKGKSPVAVDKIGVVGKKFETDRFSLQQTNNCIFLLKYRYLGSFPFDHVYNDTLDNDTFAVINAKDSKIQDEHWIMIVNSCSCQILYFADSLGCEKSGFFKQHYEQRKPELLKSHPSVCGLYTLYAVFYLFKFRQEKNRSSRC